MERPRFDQTWSPVEHLPPREQIFERATGGPALTPDAEQAVKADFKRDVFDQRFEFEGELEKSASEREITDLALAGLPDFIAQYGGRPVPFTADHVHLVNRREMSEELDDDECGGDFNAALQAAIIYMDGADEKIPQTELFHRIAHELLHGQAFQSVDHVEADSTAQRRGGLAIWLEKEGRWSGQTLNEAITEELTKRYLQHTLATANHQGMTDEQAQTRDARRFLPEGIAADEVVVSVSDVDGGQPGSFLFTYDKPRERLNALLDDLAKKNPHDLPDREAAFTMFAHAFFTGNLLPLGRLLEQTYGKNALRRLMEGETLTK